MASKSVAVPPDSSTPHNVIKDEREENDLRFAPSYVKADVPKKKTTFKITSVTKSSQRAGSGDLLDSLDDLDETVDSHTEDSSSEMFDTSSRATDIDVQDPPHSPEETVKENEPKEKPARFRVVKVETKEPFKRGRWACCDYLDAPEKVENKTEEINIKPGNASATNSVSYVPGIDDPANNPLLTGAAGTVSAYQQPPAAQNAQSTSYTPGEMFKPVQPAVFSHTSLILDTTTQMSAFSGQAAQSESMMPYAARPGVPDQLMGLSVPAVNRREGSVPVLPPMQQGETQTSQSLTGNIPYPTPDGASQRLPLPQGSMIPSSGHSQPATIAASPHQPPLSIQEYTSALVSGQAGSSEAQQGSAFQKQMPTYQDLPQQAGYGLSNGAVSSAHTIGSGATNALPPPPTPGPAASASYDGYRADGSPLTVSDSALDSLCGPSEGMSKARPNLGFGLAQIAVGVVSNADPSEDEITEEAFLQYFANLSTYGSSGLFPPFLQESGSTSAVAIDNKIEQAMDLVKSHLMYAVREEVEVLKEVIKELMERLHKVEQENKLLRSEASPDTLARLPPPLPHVQKPLLQQLMVSLNTPSSSAS